MSGFIRLAHDDYCNRSEIGEFESAKPLLTLNVCSAVLDRLGGDERSSKAIRAKQAMCMPEMQVVPVVENPDPSETYFPSCVRIKRCGGCCNHELLSCQPIATETHNYEVLTSFVYFFFSGIPQILLINTGRLAYSKLEFHVANYSSFGQCSYFWLSWRGWSEIHLSVNMPFIAVNHFFSLFFRSKCWSWEQICARTVTSRRLCHLMSTLHANAIVQRKRR